MNCEDLLFVEEHLQWEIEAVIQASRDLDRQPPARNEAWIGSMCFKVELVIAMRQETQSPRSGTAQPLGRPQ